MNQVLNFLGRFFGVVFRGDTYLNLLYVLLAFPLGLFYFVFLVPGLVTGLALSILWVGLLILLIIFFCWLGLIAIERQQAIWLLREDVPPMTPKEGTGENAWQWFVAYLKNPVTWKGLLFLLLKFPLGTLSFVIAFSLFMVTAVFLAAPLIYPFFQPEVYFTWNSVWVIDTLSEAMLAFLIGASLLFASLHIVNGMAWLWGRLGRVMLGNAPLTMQTDDVEGGLEDNVETSENVVEVAAVSEVLLEFEDDVEVEVEEVDEQEVELEVQ